MTIYIWGYDFDDSLNKKKLKLLTDNAINSKIT